MSDYADQTVAVLAVQGAFAEHEARLSELGAHCIELRQAADLQQIFDRLVLPGGESTVQGKLLAELGMLEGLRIRIVEGMPVLGTCAGLILLARDLAAHDDKGTHRQGARQCQGPVRSRWPHRRRPSRQPARRHLPPRARRRRPPPRALPPNVGKNERA